jgi:hypothetical protein
MRVLALLAIAAASVACQQTSTLSVTEKTQPNGAPIVVTSRVLNDAGDVVVTSAPAIGMPTLLPPGRYVIEASVQRMGTGELPVPPEQGSGPHGGARVGADGIPGPTVATCRIPVLLGGAPTTLVVNARVDSCTIEAENPGG